MARATEAAEREKRRAESKFVAGKRVADNQALIELRIRQAVRRRPELAELLQPVVELAEENIKLLLRAEQ